METKKQYAQNLLDFLNNAPTAFQSTDELAKMLDRSGAIHLDEGDIWKIEREKSYYFTKEGTQCAAFRICGDPRETGFRIAAAHQDMPGFRIKTVSSKIDLGIERMTLEGYGGAIVHGWLDRPLGLAGRVFVKDENGGAKAINVNIKKPLLIIPSAAIHIVRGVNDGAKFNVQTEMLPFFAQNSEGKPKFLSYLADYMGVNATDILSFELAPYEIFDGCFVGANEEFISVAGLDDASMSHAIMAGFIEAKDECTVSDIAVAFDHEEVGSNSNRGARCNTIMQIIDRICEKLGYGAEDKYRALSKTIVFSADMAHATHPSYPANHEMNLPVFLNKGPVLKLAYTQSYATSSRGTAVFKLLCEKNDIPYQIFNNRSDVKGGGTIGPIISSEYGVLTVDIGNPSLSMHAVRELGGTDDCYYMTKLFRALFKD
ncbi:MAG: M18 family aminopeptidase [Clostridia bacterium]|nr:M18 family aminopeptidase [Clostridia bacterium]